MSKSTIILVAATTLLGGIAGKKDGDPAVEFELAQGEELDKEAQKKLGLSNEDVAGLIVNGTVIEQKARLAGGSDDSPAFAALQKRADEAEADRDAHKTRADAAEAKVKEFEAAAEDAAKKAGGAKAAE